MLNLRVPETMIFALLESSLNKTTPEVSFFYEASNQDWKECAQLAKRQGVLALAWDGVCRLPENLQPYTDLKISWALAVEKYEKKYAHYCETVNELSTFYREHGISMVQLKGVGLSTYYPVPSHREGGDIDIYACMEDMSPESDAEANELSDSLVERKGIDVDRFHSKKHSLFKYNGIPVENHRTFLDVSFYPLARKVEKMLRACLNPEMAGLEGGGKVLIPSPAFNTLFVAFHNFLHYGGGLALHHLCDWACIIKKHGVLLPEELTDRYFLEGVNALTVLCNRYLGTDVKVEGGEELASEMLDEMLHPINDRKPSKTDQLSLLFFKMRRFVDMTRLKNRILHVPLYRNPVFWAKVRKSIKWHFNKILDLI